MSRIKPGVRFLETDGKLYETVKPAFAGSDWLCIRVDGDPIALTSHSCTTILRGNINPPQPLDVKQKQTILKDIGQL